ncbi:hypothetical protein M406DRAFT_333421 [Cryphonectria parasitica EP155]|uniref:Myb-like domain-containing protein n=1 Tax=Cryphonectria parasitica (strain ATCC 38755 / EP155) TaxID=660469 RepID=A0A9P4XUQ9_CRYP1|nr:uncharacterized protein M406DRAFT_333421 [Cryphonectria parasitica EP155]KAF3761353.1 hypothetical protein M406DRAFT_333421 [Cryphonectria parasitica EP155]
MAPGKVMDAEAKSNYYREIVTKAVNDTFHLRDEAQDINIAHLEIACDAAVEFAHRFNEHNPDKKFNPRWLYHCVQSILSIYFKPELMLDGKIERLTAAAAAAATHAAQQDSQEEEECADTAEPSAPQHAHVVDLSASPDDTAPQKDAAAAVFRRPAVPAPPVREGSLAWTEDDIKQMVQLKASGLTHKEVAHRMGRGVSSVENKFGRVMKDGDWAAFIAECGLRNPTGIKRKTHDKTYKEDSDGDLEDDEDARPPPFKKARSAPKIPHKSRQQCRAQ